MDLTVFNNIISGLEGLRGSWFPPSWTDDGAVNINYACRTAIPSIGVRYWRISHAQERSFARRRRKNGVAISRRRCAGEVERLVIPAIELRRMHRGDGGEGGTRARDRASSSDWSIVSPEQGAEEALRRRQLPLGLRHQLQRLLLVVSHLDDVGPIVSLLYLRARNSLGQYWIAVVR